MRFTSYMFIFLLIGGVSLFGNDKSSKKKKASELSTSKEDKEVKYKKEDNEVQLKKDFKEEKPEKESVAANTFLFQGRDIGKVWEKSEKTNQLIYSPDSMRKASKYKKFVFDLSEFKKMGGNLNQEANFTIHYSVLQTDIESKTPEDPNMPSPSGGFTYIINTCKIEKVEAN